MPKPIDEQIRIVEERMKRDRIKLRELKKKKEEMVLRAVSGQNKKTVAELVSKGTPLEEIVSALRSK